MNLFNQRHNLVTDGWNFIELILNIYHYSELMHMKFRQDVFSKYVDKGHEH